MLSLDSDQTKKQQKNQPTFEQKRLQTYPWHAHPMKTQINLRICAF